MLKLAIFLILAFLFVWAWARKRDADNNRLDREQQRVLRRMERDQRRQMREDMLVTYGVPRPPAPIEQIPTVEERLADVFNSLPSDSRAAQRELYQQLIRDAIVPEEYFALSEMVKFREEHGR
jgi:hypothetical protein